MIVFEIALILLSIFVWYVVPWALCIVFAFAIWVTTLVALGRNRQVRSESRQGLLATKYLNGLFIRGRVIVTHKHLDTVRVPLIQMITIVTILASLSLLKCIFMFVSSFAGDNENELFAVFCILPDLVFTVIVSAYGFMDLFETSQYELISEQDTESSPQLHHHINAEEMHKDTV